MAFPSVVGTPVESSTPTAGTSHVFNLPTGITAGELLIIFINKGAGIATFNALAGWTELLDENIASGIVIEYKLATGSEGASVTFTSSASTRSAGIAYRVSGAEDPAVVAPTLGTVGTGTSISPDAGNCNPGVSKDFLWFTMFGDAGEEADDDTWCNSAPTNYGNLLQKACGTSGVNLGGIVAVAYRTNTASSEDAGTFNQDASLAWRAYTIAIPPILRRKAQVSWSELEVPDSVTRKAQVSFAELEVPGLDIHLLADINNPADASSYATAGNVSIVNGRLYVAFINTSHATLEAPFPSSVVVGALSFTRIGTGQLYGSASNLLRRIETWWAVANADDSANPLSITLTGNTPSTGCLASLVEVIGFDVTDPIVDWKGGTSGSSTPNAFSVDLGTFASVRNRAVGMICHRADETSTADSGYTSIDDIHFASPAGGATTVKSNGGTDTVPGISWATAIQAGGVAIEIAADPGNERRSRISWTEFEVPDVPTTRRAQVSFSEFEIPDAVVVRMAQVSWAEFEVPDYVLRKALLSWAEFEVPSAGRLAQVSWAEFEVPSLPARAIVSWAELETPDAIRLARVSWAEFEIPDALREALISWAEFEIPDSTFRRAQVAEAEFEIPDFGPSGLAAKTSTYRSKLYFFFD